MTLLTTPRLLTPRYFDGRNARRLPVFRTLKGYRPRLVAAPVRAMGAGASKMANVAPPALMPAPAEYRQTSCADLPRAGLTAFTEAPSVPPRTTSTGGLSPLWLALALKPTVYGWRPGCRPDAAQIRTRLLYAASSGCSRNSCGRGDDFVDRPLFAAQRLHYGGRRGTGTTEARTPRLPAAERNTASSVSPRAGPSAHGDAPAAISRARRSRACRQRCCWLGACATPRCWRRRARSGCCRSVAAG